MMDGQIDAHHHGITHLVYDGHLYNKALDKREYLVIIRDNFFNSAKKKICCDPSSEPSQQDGSDEGSQHMLSMRNKTTCNYP